MKDPIPAAMDDQRPKHHVPPLCIQRDVSNSAGFKDIKRRHEAFLQPGEKQAVDFSQVQFSPDGKSVVGVATICHELQGEPGSQMATVELESGKLILLGKEKSSDQRPKWSPDGKIISFLSRVGQSTQLHLFDVNTGTVTAAPKVEGNIEQQSWSEDGKAILLLVAGLGADKSGAEGGTALVTDSSDSAESWLPAIETAGAADAYRTCWIYTLSSGSIELVTPATLSIWEAVWATNKYIVALCSDLPGEEQWYTANLREICIETKATRTLFSNEPQIECIRASPDGSKIAFAVGLASDRLVLRGDLCYVERETGKVVEADTKSMNIGWIEWSGNDSIVVAGSRDSVETIAQYNLKTGETLDAWSSSDVSIGPRWTPEFALHSEDGVKLAFVQAGWFSPPTLVHVSGTNVQEVLSFSSPQLHQEINKLGSCQNMRWKAPDGLEIQGYFLAPAGRAPSPVVLFVHGGPVAEWRPRYIGQHGNFTLMQAILAEGWGVFLPNVRGSSGRGQSFIRHVYGDMGGQDTYDYLSGLDALVESGQADEKRLAVIGGSYGGFMSSWLITQTNRFAAAVPISPVTNWVSEHYTCNIGFFCRDFLEDEPNNFSGKYFSRSPLHHVQNVTTPALMICGARDKCTPPGQALEFYRAMIEHGKCSVLLTYPEEGHGVRQMPAYFDMAARTMEWFRNFLA